MNFLIIGRPNVGKSSIYNILTGQKKNIIHVDKGTTRDWHKDNIKFSDRVFVYDSPGIILNSNKKEEKSSIYLNNALITLDNNNILSSLNIVNSNIFWKLDLSKFLSKKDLIIESFAFENNIWLFFLDWKIY